MIPAYGKWSTNRASISNAQATILTTRIRLITRQTRSQSPRRPWIGKPGATSFSLTGQPNACGGVRDAGGLSHLLPAVRLIAKKENTNEMEKLWGLPEDSLNPEPGLHTVHMFDAMREGKLKALLILCTNPAHSMPNLNAYIEALSRKDKFVCLIGASSDAETFKYADVVLAPAF